MKKKINIREIVSNRLIAEYSFDYGNTTNLADVDIIENAWQTAIKDELVNRDDRSGYTIQLINNETTFNANLSDAS